MITTKRGWTIYYDTGWAQAFRFGVRMRSNSLDQICLMIDFHEADAKQHIADMEAAHDRRELYKLELARRNHAERSQ